MAMTMQRTIRIGALAAAATALPPAVAVAGTTQPSADSQVSVLATFGSGLGSGSAVGPDGALYVTDGNAGCVLRVDLDTGAVSTFAKGLPTQVIGIGGAMDVAFHGDSAYVLVTLVGGDIVGGDPIGDATVGVYRVEEDGGFTELADIGAWSVEHPPATDFFVTTGVQYALEVTEDGLLVSDGHHNRLLHVDLDGGITEVAAFDNVVPTGLETIGDTVYIAETGPLPHRPEDGKVTAISADGGAPTEIASGARMVVDVEAGPDDRLYALAQGTWDEVQEGSPASPDTGRLVAVGDDGALAPVVDADGAEIVLDRPTSLEFVGDTAYVVTLPGEVIEIEGVAQSTY
jgi:sugar lactone lactonase YvrE